jgi:hypothetical protein
MSKADEIFLNSRRICSDDCAKEARDTQNDGIFNYNIYQNIPIECQPSNARFPQFAYDHVNLSGRAGYGISDGCTIDTYSSLRNDPAQLTRDRCRIQLFSRIFQACPNLRPGVVDPDEEMPILQGSSTSGIYEGINYPCKRGLTEVQTKQFDPLLDCSASVQNPEHVVEPWIRGGDATRDWVRRQELLSQCGKYASTRGNTRAQAVGLFQH